MKNLIALLCLSILGTGCNKQARETSSTLSGQVFIVTPERENMKLGLVAVKIYAGDVFQKVQDDARRLVDDEEKGIASAYQAAKGEFDAAHEKLSNLTSTLSKLMIERDTLTQRLAGTDKSTPAFTQTSDERTAIDDLISTHELGLKNAQESADQLKQKQAQALGRRSSMAHTILTALPHPLVESKTDADGRFQVPMKPGEFVIVAVASKDYLAKTEDYVWFVSHRSGSADARVLLSNENLEPSR